MHYSMLFPLIKLERERESTHMTLGVFYNQASLASQVFRKAASNEKIALSTNSNNNISQQIVETFSKYYSDIKKYDRSSNKDQHLTSFQGFTNESVSPQQAIAPAFTPVSSVKSFKYNPYQSSLSNEDQDTTSKLLEEIDGLVQKCYSGNSAAFKKLISLSKGSLSSVTGLIKSDLVMDEVVTKAKNAVYTLIDEAPGYPSLFQMMTESGLLDEKEFGEAANLPAKLINEAATSTIAFQQLQKLLSSGTFRLDDYGRKAIELNPDSAVATLVNLSQGNKSKDQGITIANLLSEVATNRPGSSAGEEAAKGLKKIIKSEGQNSILRAAFEGLTKAAMAGNNMALQSLKDLVVDPTISKNKAMQAVEGLTKVASSGTASGGEATKILGGLARDKRLAPQIREKVVDGLTEIASSGNGNSGIASDALLDLAKIPQDPIGKKALNNIQNMKNTDMMDQGKLTDVLETAATSNKTDNSLKKTAQNMLSSTINLIPFIDKNNDNNNNNNLIPLNNNIAFISPNASYRASFTPSDTSQNQTIFSNKFMSSMTGTDNSKPLYPTMNQFIG